MSVNRSMDKGEAEAILTRQVNHRCTDEYILLWLEVVPGRHFYLMLRELVIIDSEGKRLLPFRVTGRLYVAGTPLLLYSASERSDNKKRDS